MEKPELLAPAGNFKKLKLAFYFGADAVYLGGRDFSLRSFADNFTDAELEEGIAYAHARNKKVYVAANISAFWKRRGRTAYSSPIRACSALRKELRPAFPCTSPRRPTR